MMCRHIRLGTSEVPHRYWGRGCVAVYGSVMTGAIAGSVVGHIAGKFGYHGNIVGGLKKIYALNGVYDHFYKYPQKQKF